MPTSMVSTHTPRTCERKPPPSVGETCQWNSDQRFFKNSCTFHSRGKCASCDPLLITNRQLIVSFLSKSCAKGKPLNPGISCVQQIVGTSITAFFGKESFQACHTYPLGGCSTPPQSSLHTPCSKRWWQPRASSMGSLEANQIGG